MKSSLKILVAEDHEIVALGVNMLLQKTFEGVVVEIVSSFPDADAVLREDRFDLVILDVGLPGGKSYEMVTILRDIQPDVKILIFSGMDESVNSLYYLRSGANGYLCKNSSHSELIVAVTKVIETGSYISEYLGSLMVDDFLKPAVK